MITIKIILLLTFLIRQITLKKSVSLYLLRLWMISSTIFHQQWILNYFSFNLKCILHYTVATITMEWNLEMEEMFIYEKGKYDLKYFMLASQRSNNTCPFYWHPGLVFVPVSLPRMWCVRLSTIQKRKSKFGISQLYGNVSINFCSG